MILTLDEKRVSDINKSEFKKYLNIFLIEKDIDFIIEDKNNIYCISYDKDLKEHFKYDLLLFAQNSNKTLNHLIKNDLIEVCRELEIKIV